MTNFLLNLALGLLISGQALASESVCAASPIDDRCVLEQELVDIVLLEGLRPLKALTYCGDNNGRKSFACRRLVVYQDTSGQFTQKIFEEWLILNPGTEEESNFRGVMVQTDPEKNLYHMLWQDGASSSIHAPIEINASHPQQFDIQVEFHGIFPSFDIHYDYGSTKPLATRGIYDYAADKVTIFKYLPVLSESGKDLQRDADGKLVVGEPDEELFYDFAREEVSPELSKSESSKAL